MAVYSSPAALNIEQNYMIDEFGDNISNDNTPSEFDASEELAYSNSHSLHNLNLTITYHNLAR